jgi:hypothetical protein
MVGTTALEASLFLTSAAFPSSSLWRKLNIPNRVIPATVIIINIPVNKIARQLERNTGKYTVGGSIIPRGNRSIGLYQCPQWPGVSFWEHNDSRSKIQENLWNMIVPYPIHNSPRLQPVHAVMPHHFTAQLIICALHSFIPSFLHSFIL